MNRHAVEAALNSPWLPVACFAALGFVIMGWLLVVVWLDARRND